MSIRRPARQRHNMRRRLIEKYGSHCWLCNRPIVDEQPTFDHVTPRSRGGYDGISNLRLAHSQCNMGRADGPIPELLLTEDMMLKQLEAA